MVLVQLGRSAFKQYLEELIANQNTIIFTPNINEMNFLMNYLNKKEKP